MPAAVGRAVAERLLGAGAGELLRRGRARCGRHSVPTVAEGIVYLVGAGPATPA